MAKKPEPEAKLIEAGFGLIAQEGWRSFTLTKAARAAGMTVAETYRIAPDKAGFLDLYASRLDHRVIEELPSAGMGEAFHERLFDALMARFDLMLADREVLRVIAYDGRRDVFLVPAALRRTNRAMSRLLEAMDLAGDPIAARLSAAALSLVWARAFRVWLRDDTDQAKTMAFLDKELRRLERLMGRPSASLRSDGQKPAAETGEPPPTTH